MKKRIYSFALCLTMAVTLLPTTVSAAQLITPTFTLPDLKNRIGEQITTKDSVQTDTSQVEVTDIRWQTEEEVIVTDWNTRTIDSNAARTTALGLDHLYSAENDAYKNMYLRVKFDQNAQDQNKAYIFCSGDGDTAKLPHVNVTLTDSELYAHRMRFDRDTGSEVYEGDSFFAKPGSIHKVRVTFQLKDGYTVDTPNRAPINLKIGSTTISAVAAVKASGEGSFEYVYPKTPKTIIEGINIKARFEDGQTWGDIKKQIDANAIAGSYRLHEMPEICITNQQVSKGHKKRTVTTADFASSLTDKTTGETLRDSSELTEGHKYEMTLILKPTIGYSFACFDGENTAKYFWKKSGSLTMQNAGENDQVISNGSYVKRKGTPFWYTAFEASSNKIKYYVDRAYEYENMQVKFSFAALPEEKQVVDTAEIFARSHDAGSTQVGKLIPALDTTSNSKNCEICDNYVWYRDKIGENPLTPGSDKFEAGHTYYCMAQLEANAHFKFTDQTKVYLYRKDNDNLYGWDIRTKFVDNSGAKLTLILQKTFLPAELTDVIQGNIVYTNGAAYGATLSTGINAKANHVKLSKTDLSYQWMRRSAGSSESEWKNITDATKDYYVPTAEDIGKEIRLIASGKGKYLGTIVGEAKLVEKASQTAPAAPALEAVAVNGKYTAVRIKDYTDTMEYAYAANSSVSADKATLTVQSTVNGLTEGQTCYMYARRKETATHKAGAWSTYGSVKLAEASYLHRLIFQDTDGQYTYPEYGTGNTIYLKTGETKTINIACSPAAANQWETFSFCSLRTSQNVFSVVSPSGNITKNDPPTSIRLKGLKAGTETLGAYYRSGQYSYGTWKIVVYDDISALNINNAEIMNMPTYENTTLTIGDSYTAYTPKVSEIITRPANALNGYTLKWKVCTQYNPYGSPSWGQSNDYMEIDPDTGTVTAKASTASLTGNDAWKKQVCLMAEKTSGGTTITRQLKGYTVDVKAKSTMIMTGVHMTPTELKLNLGDTFTLTAVKVPVNTEGTASWSSNKNAVVSVDSSGKVKALQYGTAIITAKIGDRSATCTVTVIDPKHTCTADSWKSFNAVQHQGICKICDKAVFAEHTFNADGKCTVCGAAKDMSFTITVEDGTASVSKAKAGTSVTLTANTAPNYKIFSGWTDIYGNTTITDNTFVMPSGNVWIAANFDPFVVSFNGNGGTVSNETVSVDDEGKIDELPSASHANSNYVFAGWFTEASGGTQVTEDTAITSNGQTLYAHWEDTTPKPTTYSVTVQDTANGTVSVDPTHAEAGTTVTITAVPNSGYELNRLTAADSGNNSITLSGSGETYTFAMPDSDVMVQASFAKTKVVNPFVDVPAGEYYEDAVLWAVDRGITNGMTENTFEPNGTCTRAHAVTFLWRAAGKPTPKSSEMPFADVPTGSYYYQAVQWAVENGITNGTDTNTFSPDMNCSRAQIVTFLWRSESSPSVDAGNPFYDVPSDQYYTDAVLWAVKNGVTNGTDVNTFSPDAACTRGQIVTFIYRCMK